MRDRTDLRLAGWVSIHGKAYECVDVLAGTRRDPKQPLRPGEPIGPVLRTSYPGPAVVRQETRKVSRASNNIIYFFVSK